MKEKFFLIAWIWFISQSVNAQESASPGVPVIDWMETEYPAPASYDIKWNMWHGNNGSEVKLEENGQMIDSQTLVKKTPDVQ